MGWDLAREEGSEAQARAVGFTWEWLVRAVTLPEPLGALPIQAPWQERSLEPIVPGVAPGPAGGRQPVLARRAINT